MFFAINNFAVWYGGQANDLAVKQSAYLIKDTGRVRHHNSVRLKVAGWRASHREAVWCFRHLKHHVDFAVFR